MAASILADKNPGYAVECSFLKVVEFDEFSYHENILVVQLIQLVL